MKFRIMYVIAGIIIILLLMPRLATSLANNYGMTRVSRAMVETHGKGGTKWWSPESLFGKDGCPFQYIEKISNHTYLSTNNTTAAGWALFLRCELDEAAKIIIKAIEQHPANSMLHFLLGSIYQYDSKATEAALAWREGTDTWSYFKNKGELLINEQKWDMAERLYVAAIAAWPEEAFGYDGMGRVWFYGKGQPEVAITYYEKEIFLLPNNPQLDISLGELYRGEHDFERAKFWYQKALGLDTRNENAKAGLSHTWSDFGDELVRQHLWLEAETAYEQAILVQPNNASAYIGYATIQQVRDNNLSSAELWIEKALQADPKFLQSYLMMGDLHRIQKDYSGADIWYSRARNLCPDCYYPYMMLGISFFEQARYDEAKENLMNALRINSKDCWTYFHLGQVYYQQGHFGKAIENYVNAVNMCENEMVFHLALARAYRDDCRIEAGKREFLKVLGLDPTNTYAAQENEKLSEMVYVCNLDR